jgi:hypothetical protein
MGYSKPEAVVTNPNRRKTEFYLTQPINMRAALYLYKMLFSDFCYYAVAPKNMVWW